MCSTTWTSRSSPFCRRIAPAPLPTSARRWDCRPRHAGGASRSWRRLGVIKRRVAVLDADKVNAGVTVFVSIKTDKHSVAWLDKFRKAVDDFPEVIEFYRMSGDVDYLLRVVVPDIGAYDTFYKKLIERIEIAKVSSAFAMEQMKYTTALPLTFARQPKSASWWIQSVGCHPPFFTGWCIAVMRELDNAGSGLYLTGLGHEFDSNFRCGDGLGAGGGMRDRQSGCQVFGHGVAETAVVDGIVGEAGKQELGRHEARVLCPAAHRLSSRQGSRRRQDDRAKAGRRQAVRSARPAELS